MTPNSKTMPSPTIVRLQRGFGALALIIGCLRCLYLKADFPNFSPWMLDQAKYTDEGWWASAAVRHRLLGYWNLPGDYNPAVAVPVWPVSLDILFRFTGVSLVAARGLSVVFSIAALGLVFRLVNRYGKPGSEWAAPLAVWLLATSPFAFVYSRLAILDTFVVFQFCLLMLLASYAGEWPIPILAGLAILVPAIVLTKTTAIVLLPAVAWLAWSALTKWRPKSRLLALGLVALVAAALIRAYVAFVFFRGHEVDYREFYEANSLDPIDWAHAFATVRNIGISCMWTGRLFFPLAVAALAIAFLWLRGLWGNPLFCASILALAGQWAFLFATQGSYAPRYFLPMLVPMSVIVALAVAELRGRALWLYALLPCCFVVVLNVFTLISILRHRTFQFHDAAAAIGQIVRADPSGNRMLLGVSGAEISLITGLPSISDVYGTDSIAEKVAACHPGWYLAWNSVDPREQELLGGYRLVKVAAYPAFDDDERNVLILYRMER